jgi:pimeloyl-ACP methyl ester carboxylesterase
MALVSEPVLYYETAGTGPAVVLIHGGNLDRRMWDEQFQVFAKHFQVIRYDVRTFGLSDMPTRPYSDVEDLASLLRFLHIKKAHLVGLSLGGRIIVDFALQHPEMVESLVAIGPGLSGFEWSHDDDKRFDDMLRAAQDGQVGKVADLWLSSGYMAPAMENPVLARRLRTLTLDNSRHWLANPILARRIQPAALKRLDQIKAPTLLMIGSRDVPDIHKIVRTLKAGVSHAQHVVVQGAGHMVNMEKPEEFNRLVLNFLQNQGVEKVKEPDLAKELARRSSLDQESRKALIRFKAEHKLVEPVDISKLEPAVAAAYKSLQEKGQEVDRDNLAWIKTIVAKHGWPGKSLVGTSGALGAFLLVQHGVADIEFQETCLRKIGAAAKGEVEPQHLAYLTDRILVMRGRKQKYGTQGRWVNGRIVASPIEDEATVDKRRKAIGLGPLGEYLKRMEAIYKNAEGLQPVKSKSKPQSRAGFPNAPTTWVRPLTTRVADWQAFIQCKSEEFRAAAHERRWRA